MEEEAAASLSLADFLSRRARSASGSASSAGASSSVGRPAGHAEVSKRGPSAHVPSIGEMLRRKAARRARPPEPQHEVLEDVMEDGADEQEVYEQEVCWPVDGDGEAFEDDAAPGNCSNDDEEDEEDEDGDDREAGAARGRSRWWEDSVVHPNGVKNWKDLPNLAAAVSYDCRCGKKCLSRVGGEMELYEFRRSLRARAIALGQGGLRDATRDTLDAQYDRTQGSFRNTFRVGACDDACIMACAIGMGISEGTFRNARRDVTADRPRHAGRSKMRVSRRSAETESLDAWIRLQREGMEGDKLTGRRWFYGKLSEKELWKRYCADRDRAKQPLVGNAKALWALWRSHREILERPPCGQDACNFCADNLSAQDKLLGLQQDADVRAKIATLQAEKLAHDQFNKVEREHYTDAVTVAEHRPREMTCITIDAPTRHQFDLPSQARAQRDKAKKLDPSNRWQSKIEGVLDAGVGMMAYVARTCVGGGANLVCTVLMLALFCHVKLGRPLGTVLHLQLDNTTSENKCLTVIALVGLLVHRRHFHQGRIFFLHVGHTYNDLDQTFSPLITAMMLIVLPSISALLAYLQSKLAVQRVREVLDLPHLWDFDEWLLKHVDLKGGFANTQQSSGMHEMVFFLDANDEVRVKMRQTSQSSTWLPEGEGERVFLQDNPPPDGPPPDRPLSADAVWHRTEVQSNVRRWLPYLGLAPTQLASAEAEWERVFSEMPPEGGVPISSSRLQWMQLPQAVIRAQPNAATVAAATDMVENPTINPLHSRSGRTYNAVRTELRAHQADARAHAAAAGAPPPIFLSEYVFFRPRAAVDVIALGIVCKAAAGGALADDDVIDVTEYAHSGLEGYDGFFGAFRAKENPTWDTNVPGSLKFIKHRDVLRAQVKVFNVQVWKDGGRALRAHLGSLRGLAAVERSYQLARIPQSYLEAPEHHHTEGARGKGAARGAPAGGPAVGKGGGGRVGGGRAGAEGGGGAAAGGGGGTAAAGGVPVAARSRVAIYWTEAPVGWYTGVVTSSRRAANERWQSRVVYDDKHVRWHFLDDGPDSVKWRACDSSDEDDE